MKKNKKLQFYYQLLAFNS